MVQWIMCVSRAPRTICHFVHTYELKHFPIIIFHHFAALILVGSDTIACSASPSGSSLAVPLASCLCGREEEEDADVQHGKDIGRSKEHGL